MIRRQLCRQETHKELGYLGEAQIAKNDLVSSTRNLAGLCGLYRSVVSSTGWMNSLHWLTDLQAWFTEELNALKSAPEDPLSPTTPAAQLDSTDVMTPFTPSAFPAFLARGAYDEQLSLPLTRAMAM